MASLTITAPDDKSVRFRIALGKQLNGDGSQATVAQAQNFFLAKMKEYTIDYEVALDNVATRATKSAEAWS